MISKDSPLRRVPSNVNPKQAFFIDGLRHSAEIIGLAYDRLRHNLTEMALQPLDPEELQRKSPYVFLDAWAVVDAIDRFRLLYQHFPNMTYVEREGKLSLRDVTSNIKKIRDIHDHLNATADKVLSHEGAALGTLTWLTGFQGNVDAAWFCTLRPGTLREEPTFNIDEIESTLIPPTDRICLRAGPHEANLSAALPHIADRIQHLEEQFEVIFKDLVSSGALIINDVLRRQPLSRKSDNDRT